jgi:ADP-heptose:LPS heptosyltransferase
VSIPAPRDAGAVEQDATGAPGAHDLRVGVLADDVRRVLVTRLKFLGDVVLTTPLLRTLREALPQASLEYLTLAPYGPALEHHPDLDRLHLLPEGAGWRATAQLVRRLWRPRVDWWIDLLGNPRSAVLTALCRPRVAVGPARGLRSIVYHHRRSHPAGDRSAVRHHLDKLVPLLGEVAAGPVRIAVAADQRAAAEATLGLNPATRPVLLHPGSTWQSTAWPPQRWAQLAALLAHDRIGPLWVVGAPAEPGLAARVAALCSAPLRVLDPLPLRTLLALLAASAAYVGNDGGVLHCAVGLGVPAVGVFGATEPDIWFPHERFGPYRVVVQPVPCRPCHLHECVHLTCLRTLLPEEVRAALHAVLASATRSASGAPSAGAAAAGPGAAHD